MFHLTTPTQPSPFQGEGFERIILPPLIPHFSTLAPDYDVLLCDVWGVVHNGIAAFPHACDALMRARARGAIVILITNAPRQSEVVARQLEKLHVPRETLRRHRLVRRRHPRRDRGALRDKACSIWARTRPLDLHRAQNAHRAA